MDIYAVVQPRDEGRIVGASTKLQGAELIRTDEATRLTNVAHADASKETRAKWHEYHYDRMTIVNIELQDFDD